MTSLFGTISAFLAALSDSSRLTTGLLCVVCVLLKLHSLDTISLPVTSNRRSR